MKAQGLWYKYAGLAAVLAGYLLLASAYSSAIPFSKGPDEYINYQYILFIARHHRLPATLEERREAGVKADWQPLYHLTGGFAAASIPTDPPPELKVTWEPVTRRLIDIILPRATLVRTWDEQPPFRGVYAVWHTGRLVSLWLGAATLLLTWLLALQIWPDRPALATAVAGLLAFTPRFLFTHAVLSDDTMLAFWLAAYLLVMGRLWRKLANGGSPSLPLYFSAAGAAVGLSIVAKYTAAPAVLGGLLWLALLARRYGWRRQKVITAGLVFLASSTLTTGWWAGWVWWHFNRVAEDGLLLGLLRPLLPGFSVDDNPTTARLTALLTGESLAALDDAPQAGGTYLNWVVHSFQTFWGVTVFGAEPRLPYPYTLLLAVTALFCLAALYGLWRHLYRRAPANQRLIWQALVIHTVLFLPIPLLRFTLSGRLNDAAQGRHLLFPAGPAIAVMLVAGWAAWFRPKWCTPAGLAAATAMLLWGIAHLAYLNWAYPPPLPVRTTPGPQTDVAHPLTVDFGDSLRLTGYQFGLSPAGDILRLDLRWQTLNSPPEDYLTEIALYDSAGNQALRWLSQPADGRFPTRAWQAGDVVRDSLYIPVAGLPPGSYRLQLSLAGYGSPVNTMTLTDIILDPPPVNTVTLWKQGHSVNGRGAEFRYRSTIAVTAPPGTPVSITGPENRTFAPDVQASVLHLFLVDHTWPSGRYRLQAGNAAPLEFEVKNFDTRRHDGWNFTVPEMSHLTNANFNNDLLLLGYDLPLRRVKPGEGIPLVLYWQSLDRIPASYVIFDRLLDADGQVWGGYDRLPKETYPTNLWVPGEVVADGFAIPVDSAAPDGVYNIVIGLYNETDPATRSLPLVDPQTGQPTGQTSITIGPIKVGGPPPGVTVTQAEPEHAVNATFGDQITLQGYDMSISNPQSPISNPQSPIVNLKLYWQALRPPDADYTLFVHIRNTAGEVVAQRDQPVAGGRYPSSLWEPGEQVFDRVEIPLPDDLPPGRYEVVVGLYELATGQRLAVPGSADNSLLLAEFENR